MCPKTDPNTWLGVVRPRVDDVHVGLPWRAVLCELLPHRKEWKGYPQNVRRAYLQACVAAYVASRQEHWAKTKRTPSPPQFYKDYCLQDRAATRALKARDAAIAGLVTRLRARG
jgi:hypothetical protein